MQRRRPVLDCTEFLENSTSDAMPSATPFLYSGTNYVRRLRRNCLKRVSEILRINRGLEPSVHGTGVKVSFIVSEWRVNPSRLRIRLAQVRPTDGHDFTLLNGMTYVLRDTSTKPTLAATRSDCRLSSPQLQTGVKPLPWIDRATIEADAVEYPRLR